MALRHLQVAIEMNAVARFEEHRMLTLRDGMFAESADAFPVLGPACTVYVGNVSEFENAVGRHRFPPESCAAQVATLRLMSLVTQVGRCYRVNRVRC